MTELSLEEAGRSDGDAVSEQPARSQRTQARTESRERNRKRNRRLAVAACCFAVVGVYLHCAWSYQKSLDPQPARLDFQNRIADAFLAGQTSLRIPVPKSLSSLKDPYDPVANEVARSTGLHDLSYYKGKLYAYFGPAPAVLLFIPFRALHVGDLSPTLAGLIFCLVGFAFSLLLFQFLVRLLFGSIPILMECAATLALGLAIPVPFIIYIGHAYEVSIACGYAELFVGLYLLARGLFSGPRPKLWAIALGSLFLGGTVAARPSYVVVGVFLLAGLAVLVYWNRSGRLDNFGATVCALMIPFVVIGILLAYYNYVRFGSITEFGSSYQLLGENPRTYPFGRLSYLPKGFYYYLFSAARFMSHFPYAFLRASTLDPLHQNRYTNEPVAGILTNMPVVSVGLVMTVMVVKQLIHRYREVGACILLLLGVSVALLVETAYRIRGTTMRYELDFAPMLLLAALFGWLVWTRAWRSHPALFWVGQGLFALALAASIAFNLALVATPCAGTGSC